MEKRKMTQRDEVAVRMAAGILAHEGPSVEGDWLAVVAYGFADRLIEEMEKADGSSPE